MGLTISFVLKQAPAQLGVKLFAALLADYPRPNFQVRLWDGNTLGSDPPSFTVVVKHPGALREMFFAPTELTLGEAYIFDDLDIEGDIEAAFKLADYLLTRGIPGLRQSLHLGSALRDLPLRQPRRTEPRRATLLGSPHSKDRDRQAIRFHYDLPPEFFALWLDSRMLYSCAYFASEEESDLDAAQYRKLDYICRKLRLRRGDRLLDIGCGWGGLLAHAT
jgi:cyclopropane-fatty-acyl-phospholipid synthase